MYMSTLSAVSHQRQIASPSRPSMTPRQTSQEKPGSTEYVRRFTPTAQPESPSNSLSQSKSARNELDQSQPDERASTKTSSASESGVLQTSVPLDAWDRQELAGEGTSTFAPDEDDTNDSEENDDQQDDYEEGFGRMYIEQEDPAFLPSSARPTSGNSNRIMSMIKSVVIDRQSPFRHEPRSASLPTSPHQQQQQPPIAQHSTSPLKYDRTQHLAAAGNTEDSPIEGPTSVGSSFSDVSGMHVNDIRFIYIGSQQYYRAFANRFVCYSIRLGGCLYVKVQ